MSEEAISCFSPSRTHIVRAVVSGAQDMEMATLLSQDHTSLTLNGAITEGAQDSEETLSFNDHHAHIYPKTRRNMSEKDAYSILRKVQKGESRGNAVPCQNEDGAQVTREHETSRNPEGSQKGKEEKDRQNSIRRVNSFPATYPLEVTKDDHGNDVVADLDQQETIPRVLCQHHDSKPRDADPTRRKWVFRSGQKSDRGYKPNSAPQLGYSPWPSDVRGGDNTAWHNPGELANPVTSQTKASGGRKTQCPERSQSLLVQSSTRAGNHVCSHC
ncbi:hypothetical protein FQN52_004481 [Onygenales sp. PD_12]|nr:hypothetical protein FQN52_004481 [Onygenales sp. PD_12]